MYLSEFAEPRDVTRTYIFWYQANAKILKTWWCSFLYCAVGTSTRADACRTCTYKRARLPFNAKRRRKTPSRMETHVQLQHQLCLHLLKRSSSLYSIVPLCVRSWGSNNRFTTDLPKCKCCHHTFQTERRNIYNLPKHLKVTQRI